MAMAPKRVKLRKIQGGIGGHAKKTLGDICMARSSAYMDARQLVGLGRGRYRGCPGLRDDGGQLWLDGTNNSGRA